MDRSKPKPTPKSGSADDPRLGHDSTEHGAAEAPKNSGRVQFDDRGQAIWEWSTATGKFHTASTSARLKKLTNVELSLVDEEPAPNQAVRVNPSGTKKGYDPYDSGQLSKRAGKPVKKDLRKLGEWLKMKKERGES